MRLRLKNITAIEQTNKGPLIIDILDERNVIMSVLMVECSIFS